MPRDKFQRQSLGVALSTQLQQTRVLVVGAGGIGCELLKNLVLSGFNEIHLVDLDTIDLSNLNRQFLFRHEHIKRPKALVAKESAGRFNPNVQIEAHHANIKDPRFTIDWFRSFQVVFNALDNLEARRHVNKMCLAADVPLIESGTTGFNGQVQVIRKKRSECYDCNPKETPKTFAVCTIRSTPSQPIHCIVWAKSYLFTEIFGTSEDDAQDLDTTEDSGNAKEIETLRQEARALKVIRESMGSADFPRRVFQKVFSDDIKRLRGMEDMWQSRRKPDVLSYDDLSAQASEDGRHVDHDDQAVWTTAQNFAVFSKSLQELSARLEQLRATSEHENAPPILTFDKDDDDSLDFVTSAANLRAIIFGIEPKSEFEVKQLAGRIIPAIATTNAMTAGLCVLQAYKVLRDDYHKARNVFLAKSNDRIISSEPLRPPRSECAVCGVTQARVDVDLSRASLNDLVEDLLRLELGYGQELSVSSDQGVLFDPELDDNLPKKLSELSVKHDSFITVVDEASEDPRVNLVLAVFEKNLADQDKPILLVDKFEIARKTKSSSEHITNGHTNGQASDGLSINGIKDVSRKRSADEAGLEAQLASKRGKVIESSTAKSSDTDDVVVLDGASGPIVLD
ncbi:MAG: E1 ubiquitin-activating protein uba2 [Chrysothrix sp. TS-e1954]|nr:MAG: E1 ubiquitin-activating protein uba2 [Chrysothrix sp. TS-e1954]